MISGEKIRQARELRGLTQTELAKAVGINQSAIAHLEAGLYAPTELVSAIAFHTGFPPSFFEDAYVEDFPVGSLQFRGRAAMTRRDRLQAYRYAQTVFQLYTKLTRRVSQMPRLALPRLDDVAPEQAAQMTRSALGLGFDTPIQHVINSAEQAGVTILGLPTALEGREAFSMWSQGRPIVAVSTSRPGDRLRLSVAHELGHLVLHHALRGTMAELEHQAYAFAAELLMPRAALMQELTAPVTLATLAPLKLRWRVSLQALIRRARDLTIISERQYYYLSEQIARSGLRKAEPENLSIPTEKPRALRQLAELLYGRPIDLRRLAIDTNLTPQFLSDVLGAHAEGASPASKSPRRQLTVLRQSDRK